MCPTMEPWPGTLGFSRSSQKFPDVFPKITCSLVDDAHVSCFFEANPGRGIARKKRCVLIGPWWGSSSRALLLLGASGECWGCVCFCRLMSDWHGLNLQKKISTVAVKREHDVAKLYKIEDEMLRWGFGIFLPGCSETNKSEFPLFPGCFLSGLAHWCRCRSGCAQRLSTKDLFF